MHTRNNQTELKVRMRLNFVLQRLDYTIVRTTHRYNSNIAHSDFNQFDLLLSLNLSEYQPKPAYQSQNSASLDKPVRPQTNIFFKIICPSLICSLQTLRAAFAVLFSQALIFFPSPNAHSTILMPKSSSVQLDQATLCDQADHIFIQREVLFNNSRT